MNSFPPVFAQLGLDDKQSRVYMAALQLGAASVQELSKKSGIKRTSIYNFLDEMKARGLLGETREKHKRIFVAEDPHTLVQQAKDHVRSLERIIPDLLDIYNEPGNKPAVRFYQGIDGLKKIYEDTLRECADIYAFSDFEGIFGVIGPDWSWEYARRRASLKIQFFGIGKNGHWFKEAHKRNKEQNRKLRNAGNVEFDTEVNIYGNKVALLSFRRPYAGVIIEDRAIAATLLSVWKMVWNSLEKK